MVEAPTGTVSLVFTDIQGSTSLWEHFGGEFKSVLDRHNRIFREAIDEFGGYEVKTEGDAFMVAFQEAEPAVAMCLAVQERLYEAQWSDTLSGPYTLDDIEVVSMAGATEDGLHRGLRVRMGVHTGEVDAEPDPVTGRMDYFGRMVNRAARVGGVGHGGQLLVSDAAWRAAFATGSFADVEVTDLGEHALKGLERRERLRQLLPLALAGRTFPRLRTPNLKKTNLPTRIDSFFGREEEMAELESRVADGQRLITLLGAGGTGKTRLSQRFGAKMLGEFPGGVWMCDLCEARSAHGIVTAVGAALDVPLTQEDPEAQIANAILGRGRTLFLLDNFEQVAECAPETVGRWLQRAPEAVFLVTSQVLLRIAGEKAFYLAPLPATEAIDLFFDRARAVQPSIVRTPENTPVVQEIVERLDCMSLAVELAAARVRLLPPEKILSRLSQRFKLLRGERRDQVARQATLRGAIDWSWDLLQPPECAALAQLSVFHGGCSLEAAEDVVELSDFEDDPWVLDVLQKLVDHSLLRLVEPYPGEVRYRMLESIRVYASEKLGDDALATASRHAQFFASYGSEESLDALSHHGSVDRRKKLGLDLENLVVAVETALATGDVEVAAGCGLAASVLFQMQGPFSNGIQLLEKLTVAQLGPDTLGRIFGASGWLLRHAGPADKALDHLQRALELVREAGNRRSEGITLMNLGDLHRRQGRIPESLELFVQALAIHRETGNRLFEGITLGSMASVSQDQGRGGEAVDLYTEALAIAREVGDRQTEGTTLGNLGLIHQQQGRIEEAHRYFGKALEVQREVGNRLREGISLKMLGQYHQEQGRPDEALSCYVKALEIARELGDRRNEGITLGDLALCHQEQGRVDDALGDYRRALEVARELGNRRNEAINLGNLGDLLAAQGESEAAAEHLQKAIAIGEQVFPVAVGAFGGSLALLRAQAGAFEEAYALLEQGEPTLRGVYAAELGKFLCKKARVEQLVGKQDAALACVAEAEAIATDLRVEPSSELGQALVEVRGQLGTS